MLKKSSKKPTTLFQKRIYSIVKKIPVGKVLTYKEVARLAGNPLAWRSSANILNKNYDSKIPCHRVIRSDLRIGGYNRGKGEKKYLLKKEGVIIRNKKVI